MVETKLIVITGMSGAGKSTTAQNLPCQYQLNRIRYRWLHEEIKKPPYPRRGVQYRIAL